MRTAFVTLFLVAGTITAQDVTVGILPFIDATASGGDAGLMVARTVQADLLRSSALTGRILTLSDGLRPENLDQAKAIEQGKTQNVDFVLVGTILEARTEESSKSGWSPSILRQSGGWNVRSAKAAVTLQGILYNVKTGERVGNSRVTGKSAERKVGGSVYTTMGQWGSNPSQFLESPLGAAVSEAVGNLIKAVTEAAAARK